ncbi:hypothetical protein [Shimia sp. MIT1388]|uniref:hypothetical protein n=1 Tax=Shimia sp. MIT1388 TaxID=3096992 RepID=UPI00399B2C06
MTEKSPTKPSPTSQQSTGPVVINDPEKVVEQARKIIKRKRPGKNERKALPPFVFCMDPKDNWDLHFDGQHLGTICQGPACDNAFEAITEFCVFQVATSSSDESQKSLLEEWPATIIIDGQHWHETIGSLAKQSNQRH